MRTLELQKTVLGLPPRKRALMASRLLESLGSGAERAHAVEWSEEADARVAAYDAGKIGAKDAVEVLAYRGGRRK